MSQSVCVYASDLAVALGINQYQKLSDLIIKIWSHSFAEDYEQTLQNLQQTHNVTFQPKDDDLQAFKKTAAQTGQVQLQKKMNDLLQTTSTPTLVKKRAELKKEIRDNKQLSVQQKSDLTNALTGATNKNFGTQQESTTIQVYEKLLNAHVLCPTKFFRRQICEHDGIRWYLGGKVDGLATNEANVTTVIEVKNRIHRLFRKMRDYERPQIQAYMWMLELENGHLVESHKRGNVPEIHILEERFDPIYWNNVVVAGMQRFIRLFHHFLSDVNLKTMVLIGPEDEREQLLKKMI